MPGILGSPSSTPNSHSPSYSVRFLRRNEAVIRSPRCARRETRLLPLWRDSMEPLESLRLDDRRREESVPPTEVDTEAGGCSPETGVTGVLGVSESIKPRLLLALFRWMLEWSGGPQSVTLPPLCTLCETEAASCSSRPSEALGVRCSRDSKSRLIAGGIECRNHESCRCWAMRCCRLRWLADDPKWFRKHPSGSSTDPWSGLRSSRLWRW